MQRLPTTVVAVVGSHARDALEATPTGMNLRIVQPTDDPVAAWGEVKRSRRPFTLIGDDPLGEVAAAWQRLFEERTATGALEVAVSETTGRVRAGSVDLPDFYLVAGDAPFHLSALAPSAPNRVVPVDGDLGRAVSRLRAGRWWPPIDTLLDRLDHRLPDVFTTPEDRDGPTLVTG